MTLELLAQKQEEWQNRMEGMLLKAHNSMPASTSEFFSEFKVSQEETNKKLEEHISMVADHIVKDGEFQDGLKKFILRVEPALTTYEKAQGTGWVMTKIAIFITAMGGAYLVLRQVFWN